MLSLLLFSFVNSALDEGEWSTSRSGRFSLRGKVPPVAFAGSEGGGLCSKAGVGFWVKSVCNPRPAGREANIFFAPSFITWLRFGLDHVMHVLQKKPSAVSCSNMALTALRRCSV